MNTKNALKNIHENEVHPYRKIVLSLIYLNEKINKRGQLMKYDEQKKIEIQYDIAKNTLKEMENLKYKEAEFVLNRINNCSCIDESIFCYGCSYSGNDDVDDLYFNFKENAIDPKIAFENLKQKSPI